MSARDALARRLARRLAIGAPLAWLALFFVAPAIGAILGALLFRFRVIDASS